MHSQPEEKETSELTDGACAAGVRLGGGAGGSRRARLTAAAERMGRFSNGARAGTYLVAEGRGKAIRARGGRVRWAEQYVRSRPEETRKDKPERANGA